MKECLRVLNVADSEDDTRLLLRELERSDYEIAHERVENVAALRTALDRQSWDILFCDFNLPAFGSETALEIVKKRDLDLPFIFISETLGEDVAVQAMKAGAHDYVMTNNLARLVPAMKRELKEAKAWRLSRQKNQEEANLLDLAHDAIFVHRLDEKIQYWNKGAEQLYGWTAEEAIDGDFGKMVYEDRV
jgi:DNA-binding NtrC family response regulator